MVSRRARVHLDAAVPLGDRGDRRFQARLVRRLRRDRLHEALRAVQEGDAASRLLREREAAARERVPAKHRHSAGVVQVPVRKRLELGPEDVALLLVEVELLDALRDRLPVEARQLVRREERVVRKRKRLLDAVDELVPAPLGNRVALRDRPRAALVAHEPARDLRVLAELDPEPGTRDLRPDVRLMPVHPAAAELDVGVVPAVRPGAATQPVARLEEERGGPAQGRLAGGRDAREPTADDDDVVHGRRIYPPGLTAGKSRVVSGPCGGRRYSS